MELPPVMTHAAPRTAYIDPSVAMIEGTFRRTTRKPLIRPTITPITMQIRIATAMGKPLLTISAAYVGALPDTVSVVSGKRVLLLDEPTRNLSPLSAPVIRALLLDFPGAILAVTHDRLLMQQWPGRVLRLTENGLSDVTAAVKSQSGTVKS